LEVELEVASPLVRSTARVRTVPPLVMTDAGGTSASVALGLSSARSTGSTELASSALVSPTEWRVAAVADRSHIQTASHAVVPLVATPVRASAILSRGTAAATTGTAGASSTPGSAAAAAAALPIVMDGASVDRYRQMEMRMGFHSDSGLAAAAAQPPAAKRARHDRSTPPRTSSDA
jgi:hypothetical protein